MTGHTPALLKSGRQDQDFYSALWHDLVHKHYWEGEIWNRRKNGEIYPEWLSVSAVVDDKGQPTHFIGAFSDITSAKEAQRQIQWLSNFDGLTGLPNMTLLRDRTEQALVHAIEHGECLGMIKIDLDQFKAINDSLSHTRGDELLVSMARRLEQVIGAQDTLSRQSGNEFMLLLPKHNQRDTAEVAQRLQQAMTAPVVIDGHELVLTASLGIALL